MNKLLDKVLSGEIDRSEKEQLQRYIQNSYNDDVLNDFMQQHWDALEHFVGDVNDKKLTLLKKKIHEKAFPRKTSKDKVRQLGSNWKYHLLRVAAVLSVPLLATSLYFSYQLYSNQKLASRDVMQQVIATPGSRVHFTLPDKSEVWLNSGSSLEFPVNLDDQSQRRVKLHGQGYFNVSHDQKHPFFVEAGEMNIKVLGTSFDISSYSDDETICSTLEEGSIALLNAKGHEIGKLIPGEKAILNKQTNELEIVKVDTHLFTSWKDGRLIFRNTPLTIVTKQLERWFNCNIHVDPKLANSNILYTATIQQETLEEVLKMIEISTSVKTKIVNREVNIWSK